MIDKIFSQCDHFYVTSGRKSWKTLSFWSMKVYFYKNCNDASLAGSIMIYEPHQLDNSVCGAN